MAGSLHMQLFRGVLVFVSILGSSYAQEAEPAVNETTAFAPILYTAGNTWDLPDKTLLTLETHELLGIWKAEGAQSPRAEFENQEGQMPNCTAYPNEFDFRHNINDDQFLVFALDAAVPDRHVQIGVGHRESYSSNITSYTDNLLTLNLGGDGYCQSFYTYLDRNTGQVKARTVYNGVYSQGADGEVSYTSLNCNATATPEIPGCFEEPGENGATNVRAASVFTWVCQQGECGVFSPLFTQFDINNPAAEDA